MVAHEHEGVNAPRRSFDRERENVEKLTPIRIVLKYAGAGVAAARDVPDGVLMVEPKGTGHSYKLIVATARDRLLLVQVHTFTDLTP